MTEQSSFSTATTWSERFPTRAFSVSVADHIRASEESQSAFLVTKRIVDLLLGSVLLVFATPIILAAMLLIWFTDRGPALFVQERVGHRCLPFRMLKLRTMQIGSDFPEDQRRSQGDAVRILASLVIDRRAAAADQRAARRHEPHRTTSTAAV